MEIHFVNKDDFDRMLDPVLPDRPWLNPISEIDTEIANYLADLIPGRLIPNKNQLSLFDPQPFY